MLGDEVQQKAETQTPQPLTPNYQFNAEELAAIRECNSESFFQRSLPLMSLLGTSVYFGVKRGILKASPKYGAIPKILGVTVFGYFAGKFSYQKKCMEKLMLLPNSPVGALLRQRFKQGLQASPAEIITSTFPSFNSPSINTDSDRPDRDNINLDTDRPTFAGLEDTYRPSLDGTSFESRDLPQDKMPTLSYDDLRKRNRESESNVNPYKLPENPPPVSRPSQLSTEAKNQYGDVLN